jgi:hypothetical protein
MVELRVSAGTTLQELQSFMKDVGATDSLRGKRNEDGSITLYSKESGKFSFGLKRKQRADKTAAAKDAIGLVLSKTAGTNINATKALANVVSRHVTNEHTTALRKTTVDALIQDAGAAIRQHNNSVIDKVSQTIVPELFADGGKLMGLTLKIEDHPNLGYDVANAIRRESDGGKTPLDERQAMAIAKRVVGEKLELISGLLDAFDKEPQLTAENGSKLDITKEMRTIFERYVCSTEMAEVSLPLTAKQLNSVYNNAVAEHVSTHEVPGDRNATTEVLKEVLARRGLDKPLDELGLDLDGLELRDFKNKDVRKKITDQGHAGSVPLSLEQVRTITSGRCEKLASQIDSILKAADGLKLKGAEGDDIAQIKKVTVANLGRPEFVDGVFALRNSANAMREALLDEGTGLSDKLNAIVRHYVTIGEQAANSLSLISMEDRGPDDGAIFQAIYNELAFGGASGLGEEDRKALRTFLDSPEVLSLEGALSMLQEVAEDPSDGMKLLGNIRDLRRAVGGDGPPPNPPVYASFAEVPEATQLVLKAVAPIATRGL